MHGQYISYQYALSDSILKSAVSLFNETYSLIFSKPLKTPSTAKSEGALVVGSSPQQLSLNFFISYSTYLMPNLLSRSTAFAESSELSTSRTDSRLTTGI